MAVASGASREPRCALSVPTIPTIPAGWPQLSERARSLWAKTGDEGLSLSLAQHLEDAGDVAAALWDGWVCGALRERLGEMTGLNPEELRSFVIWCAATHDIGKATLNFQRQIEDRSEHAHLVAAVADSGLPLEWENSRYYLEKKIPHSWSSAAIIEEWLYSHGMGENRRKKIRAKRIAAVAGAHHGVAAESDALNLARDALKTYPESWRQVHGELLDAAAASSGVTAALDKLAKNPSLAAPAQELLTGIVVMADWIASNQDAFPLRGGSDQRARVEAGLEAVDLTGSWSAADRAPSRFATAAEYYRSAFGWGAEGAPRPVQEAVLEAVRGLGGPGLLIVEAPTGEGKTEAALAAAHALAARVGSQGVMVAAPTLSTANGLFERVVAWSRSVTGEGEVSSMFLAHSKSALSEPYRRLRFSGIAQEDDPTGEADSGDGGGAVVASQWLSGRKKGMLANFVVGTVDQVLMLALQMRHSMLRHLGLAGKAIIVDEVHAYDAYMSSYLGRALEWLAYYGVPVILLSATLPAQQKQKLAAAYASQTCGDLPPLEAAGYPLLTTVSDSGAAQTPVPARPDDIAASVSWLEEGDTALHNAVSELVGDGGCLLIVCNTVARAQRAYELLCEDFPGVVELHHAAFLASERAEKEDRLRAKLGPRSHRGAGRPELCIVVATQVAEQSLDIDADALITDVAPIDLIVQRIGRVHRHRRPASDRPEKLRAARVLVRGVEARDPAPSFDAGTAAVYDEKILLATVAALDEDVVPGGFHRPSGVPALVQRVYADDPKVPEEWVEALEKAAERHQYERSDQERRAVSYQIPHPTDDAAQRLSGLFSRYSRAHEKNVRAGEEAGLAQVRDSDPTVEVIPIVEGDYGYRPYRRPDADELEFDTSPGYATAYELASSTVRLPSSFTRYAEVFDKTLDELEGQTPPGWAQHHLLKGQLALVLDRTHQAHLAGKTLKYSSEKGLEILKSN